jgi:hypothetical protein
MDINSRVRLNNGVEMPYLGLGTWLMSRREAHTCVGWALEAGYRHIDTAKLYANEREVGAAVRESGIPREDIFVTTKLIDEDQGYRRTFQGFNESLSKMGLDYIDLYLIHFPVARLRGDSWRAMVEILQTGAVRAIGVSNYVEQHLDELLARSTVVPAVNQVMCNPYVYPVHVQDYCRPRVEDQRPEARTHREAVRKDSRAGPHQVGDAEADPGDTEVGAPRSHNRKRGCLRFRTGAGGRGDTGLPQRRHLVCLRCAWHQTTFRKQGHDVGEDLWDT